MKKKRFSLVVGILVFVFILAYAFSGIKELILGPRLSILAPKNGALFDKELMAVRGEVKNIASLTLNDRPIFTDEKGVFKEKLLLYEGYNILKLVSSV